jgi:hypothetical protein
MRFTVDGRLLKVMLVPLVDATAVPDVRVDTVVQVGDAADPADVSTCPLVP